MSSLMEPLCNAGRCMFRKPVFSTGKSRKLARRKVFLPRGNVLLPQGMVILPEGMVYASPKVEESWIRVRGGSREQRKTKTERRNQCFIIDKSRFDFLIQNI